jgi:hypothetical protein
MLDIHDRIVQAITRRDTAGAVQELEIHYDVQIEQIYEQNEENGHDQPNGGPNRTRPSAKEVMTAPFVEPGKAGGL